MEHVRVSSWRGKGHFQTQPALLRSTAVSPNLLGNDLEWEEMPLGSVRGEGELGGGRV